MAAEISVIMPCRNAMPFLPFAVDDLARATGCRLELLICDDGSSDGSLQWLQGLEAELSSAPALPSSEPRAAGVLLPEDPLSLHGEAARGAAPPEEKGFVTQEPWPGEDLAAAPSAADVARRMRLAGHELVLLKAGGKGQGAAQNMCLERASKGLVSLMDADDRAVPERFERLLRALEEEKGWQGVCSGVKIFGSVSAGMARYVDWQNSLVDPEEMLSNRFVEIPALHQTGIYPVGLLRDVLGGYRDLPSWPIDMDTWMRLGEARAVIGKVPEQLYGWRQHTLQSTRNHGRCSLEHLRRCRAHFWLRSLPPSVSRVEVWSVGQTLQAWGEALTEAASDLPAVELVEWRPARRKRRGGARNREEEPAAAACALPRRSLEPGELPAAEPAEELARLFAFGSAEVRDQARAAVAPGRWARLDWPAA